MDKVTLHNFVAGSTCILIVPFPKFQFKVPVTGLMPLKGLGTAVHPREHHSSFLFLQAHIGWNDTLLCLPSQCRKMQPVNSMNIYNYGNHVMLCSSKETHQLLWCAVPCQVQWLPFNTLNNYNCFYGRQVGFTRSDFMFKLLVLYRCIAKKHMGIIPEFIFI